MITTYRTILHITYYGMGCIRYESVATGLADVVGISSHFQSSSYYGVLSYEDFVLGIYVRFLTGVGDLCHSSR